MTSCRCAAPLHLQFTIATEADPLLVQDPILAEEGCIEIASHIVSADRLGAPTDHAHLFSLLEENRVLPADTAEAMRGMARFRNRIVHLYRDVDLDLVYEYVTEKLGDLDSFLAAIDAYLGK